MTDKKLILPRDTDPRVLSMIGSLLIDQYEWRVPAEPEHVKDDIIAIVRALGEKATARNIKLMMKHYYINDWVWLDVFGDMWGYELYQDGKEPYGVWRVTADKEKTE